MVVNSLNFLLFFIVVFFIYYLPVSKSSSRFQNCWLLASSYFFYGFTEWRMLFLLIGATIVFYVLGLWLGNEIRKKNTRLASRVTTLGVLAGIALLLYFKYLNFFADSFYSLLNAVGFQVTWSTLNIVLPLGLSFFTFKLISYVIEVHREHIEPCKDFVEFATYVAFFPTILSGPIDRPNKFLPQLRAVHQFDYTLAVDGCRQILWGMFTKMCIADNLASITDDAWTHYADKNASTLFVAALLYMFQMYADFDGYSNMAIGVGKILGFKITRNFNHPLLARNVAEYWRRWHMSLTSWITDYVFMPLNIAFRNYGNYGVIIAVITNLVVIGLWHGANWTYGLFGLFHGLLFIPLVFSGAFGRKKKLRPAKSGWPKREDFFNMVYTFLLVSAGLVIFRAPSVGDSFSYFGNMFSLSFFSLPEIESFRSVIFLPILIITEWLARDKEYGLAYYVEHQWMAARPIGRWMLYLLLFVITVSCRGYLTDFIYFQF